MTPIIPNTPKTSGTIKSLTKLPHTKQGGGQSIGKGGQMMMMIIMIMTVAQAKRGFLKENMVIDFKG